MSARKPQVQIRPAPVAGRPGKDSKAADGEGDVGTGGMIGEGDSGQSAADVTEDDPRTTRPGGMIGEG